MANRWGKSGSSDRFYFVSSKITAGSDCSHEIKRLASWKKTCSKHKRRIKKQRHYFADNGPSSQSYGFSSSRVWMWEVDHKESWVPKNWWFQVAMLKKPFESPLDNKEIKPVNPKENQSWVVVGRTDAEAEVPILWPPNAKCQFIGKDLDAGKDCGQEENGATEDELVGWHLRLNEHEFEQTPGDSKGQGSLASCSSWGHKELDMTYRLNNNNNNIR